MIFENEGGGGEGGLRPFGTFPKIPFGGATRP